MSSIDENVAVPTEELVDSALGKSAQLIVELAKLGITLDSDECSDGASTCSGLPSSREYSSSDAEYESGYEEPERRSSMSRLAIDANERKIEKLLEVREKVRLLRQCMGQDDASIIKQSSEAISRLEAHLQGLTRAAEASHNAHTEARLQKLEEAVEQVKRGRQSMNLACSRSASRVVPAPALRATSPARSPSPSRFVTAQTLRATSPVRIPTSEARNLSPAQTPRKSLPATLAKPKRLFCQQVAHTKVYNVWSMHS
jgi:hypothetical protein